MNHPIRLVLMLLGSVAMLLCWQPNADAQVRDSVEVIETPGSAPYRCCLTFVVTSRQTRPTTIPEFHVRILSGRASFVPGTASSPQDWTVFVANDQMSVAWYATSSTSEIDSGRSKSGFSICAADTGIVRLVWETRNLDTVYSRDTVTISCRGIDCDEAFFRRVPSNEVCLYDVDLINGNRRDLAINDFRLKIITPGVRFNTGAQPVPAGWLRSRISADSIQYFTSNRAVRFGQFVEGFRFQADNVADSFRVIYRTFNNGDLLCTDTVTLFCSALDASDSLDVRSRPGCCSDLRLTNAHRPGSPIDRFVLRMTTTGARIATAPVAPPGWTRGPIPAAGDSVFYTRTIPLATGDTSLFSGLCFNNALAANDTIRYSWTTYSAGIPVMRGIQTQVCLRPLTQCDSAIATVDSSAGGQEGCVSLVILNRNSRDESITRVVARISNPGTARRILTASAPAGWVVQSVGGDSVVYTGSEIFADEQERFTFCVSVGDTTMLDPLSITWRTDGPRGTLCTGVIPVNVRIIRSSDIAVISEYPSLDPTMCCYKVLFHNRNTAGRPLTGFVLEVVNANVLFGDATAASPWTVTTSGFPSPQVGFSGSSIAAGDSTPEFTFCIDARNVQGRPATIPITWRSYSDAEIVTSERIDLRCVGRTSGECDTVMLVDARRNEGACTYEFAIGNRHSPASSIDRVQFVLQSAGGQFSSAVAEDQAAGWTQVTVRPDTVVFRGDSILTGTTIASFVVQVAQQEGAATTFEVSTFNGDLAVCRETVTASCATGGISVPHEPSGFRLGDATPNPMSGSTAVAYELKRVAAVTFDLHNERGELVRRIVEGVRAIGRHSLVLTADELPSGVYLYTMEAGGERQTKQLVIVR